MNHRSDPFELLAQLTPPGLPDAAPVDLEADPTAAATLGRVFAGAVVVSLDEARRRRRRRVAAGSVVVVLVGFGSVAAASWLQRSPDEARMLTCWSAAISPPPIQAGVSWDGQDDPISACETAWASGELGEPVPDSFAVCVNDFGLAAVIPGPTDTCEQLELADYIPVTDPDVLAVQIAQETLEGLLNGQTCRGRDEARIQTRQTLDDVGLDHWVIDDTTLFTDVQPCAAIGLDPESETAFVVPVARSG